MRALKYFAGIAVALVVPQFWDVARSVSLRDVPPIRVPNNPDLVARLRKVANSICSIDVAGRGVRPFRDGQPLTEDDADIPEKCVVHVGELYAVVRKGELRLSTISLSESNPPGRVWDDKVALTPQQVAEDAEKICKAVSYGLPVTVTRLDAIPSNLEFSVNVVGIYRGFRYAGLHGAVVTIDYETGRLHTAYLWEYPAPPADLRVKLSPEDARAQMLGYVMSAKGCDTLEERDPVELVVWRPRGLGLLKDDFTDAGHAQMAKANQGLLVYRAMFSRPEGGNYAAFVDPVSGKLLNVDDMTQGLGGAPRLKPAVTTFDWHRYAGRVDACAAGKAVVCKSASIEPIAVPGAPPTGGVPVALFAKPDAVKATFFPKEGLLSVTVGKEARWGRPNKALRKALERAIGGQ